jgi:hypothetical protein
MDQSEYRQWCRAMNERSIPLSKRFEFAAIALHYQLDIEDQISQFPNVVPIDKKKFAHERDKTTALMWLIKQHLEIIPGPRAKDHA